MAKKCQRKHREFDFFPQKKQGILSAHFLIQKVKDIARFAADFFLYAMSGKICSQTGNKQGKQRKFENAGTLQYFLVCSFGKNMEKWQFSVGYGQIGVYSRDAIFPDFSGIPDFHKSKLSMKNL